MSNKEFYQLTIDKNQLKLLSFACNLVSRLIVGQTDELIHDIIIPAIHKHYDWEKEREAYNAALHLCRELCDDLHRLGWRQAVNEYNGINYNDDADVLFDLYQVMRHQLWQENPNRQEYTVDAYTPMKHGDSSLAFIKRYDSELKE